MNNKWRKRNYTRLFKKNIGRISITNPSNGYRKKINVNIKGETRTDDVKSNTSRMANLTHSIDAAILRRCLSKLFADKINDVLPIHDCIMIHPNHGDKLKKYYAEAFSEVIQETLNSFAEDGIKWPKGSLDLNEIKNSKNLLTL